MTEGPTENSVATVSRTREWVATGVTVAFTGFFIWRSVVSGQRVFPIILGVGLAAIIWWSWPGRQKGPHTSHQEALVEAGPDGAIIYWRPG